MMYAYRDHMGGAGWLLMSLLLLIFLAALAVGVIALVRSTQGRSQPGVDARRLLDERFARGEIDADDYAQRRDLLDRR